MANANFVVTPIMGVTLDSTDASGSPSHTKGTTVLSNDHRLYVYVQAKSAFAKGSALITLGSDYSATSGASANAQNYQIDSAVGAVTAGQFVWVFDKSVPTEPAGAGA